MILGRDPRGLGLGELAVASLASLGAVAFTTGAIAVLESWVPVLSLGALYLFAVLPIAVVWGMAFAVPVAVGSMLTFNWFFLPPRHTLRLTDSENWLALALYLAVAVVVSQLASRARRRTRDAEGRRREAELLASAATSLLSGRAVADVLGEIATGAAAVLGVPHASIVLGDAGVADGDRHPLEADGRVIGTLVTTPRQRDPDVERRFLPALASLIAVAIDRERLEREALEAESLRRSDAIKTNVLRAVSHDLRSPLTAIAAAADGLADPGIRLDEAGRATLVDTIRAASGRLDRLVADLLDLSRLEAGAAQPNRELWQLDELVGLALDELHDDGRVEVAVPASLPPALVDASHVRRILVNLLENARRHAGEGGHVSVAAREEGDRIAVSISDDGPGIPADEVEKVFEPFRRGAAGSRQPGSGLGLAIARGFAHVNGGTLRVAPSRRGATLLLELPAGGRGASAS